MKAELQPISSALDSDGRSRLPKKNARWSAYSHLLIARMRELLKDGVRGARLAIEAGEKFNSFTNRQLF